MDKNVLILSTNVAFSMLTFWIIAKLYILPNLSKWKSKTVLLPLLLLQSTRHLGLMFLASGAVYVGMPSVFAVPSGVGDFTSALLALCTIPLVLRGAKSMWPMLWVLTIFGTADFILAIGLSVANHTAVFMGATWWIPAFWVPLLLVDHYVTFVILLRHRKMATA